jgi:hypothetical protein
MEQSDGDRLQMRRRRLHELLYRRKVFNVEVVVDGKVLTGDVLAVDHYRAGVRDGKDVPK